MLAHNSVCRFAVLMLLRKRKQLLPSGSTLPDRIDRAYGGRALSKVKTILSESRNFSGSAQLQSACQHIGVCWLLILAPDHDLCCELVQHTLAGSTALGLRSIPRQDHGESAITGTFLQMTAVLVVACLRHLGGELGALTGPR